MTLEEIIIVNYRSCKLLSIDLKDQIPNVFIGLNDCGKSSILLALDLLLGAKPTYNINGEGSNKSDLSNSCVSIGDLEELLSQKGLPTFNYNGNETIVFGKLKFTDEEEKEYDSMELSNYLLWALENTSENNIWIANVYSSSGSLLYLLTKDFLPQIKLWEYTAANLKKYIKENDISPEEIENENGKGRFTNLEQFRAAYKKEELINCWSYFKLTPKDKLIFPEFNYFDWNCSFEDINALANSIMKDEIEIHLTPLKLAANEAAIRAEVEINKKFGELSKTISSVAKNVEGINSKVYFNVKEKISDIMVQKKNSDGFIHLENQGEGLKRQIWFSLIKSKAETSGKSNENKFIWAFDEPETHLYPAAQREFYDILSNVSNGNVQTLISTHSTVFIDKSEINTITSVFQEEDGYSVVNYCKDVDTIYNSLGVKNSDFLFYDKFLVVEGDTEQYLIPKLYELYSGNSLLSDNIQLINIQGKDNWVLNKRLIDKIMSGFKKSEDYIVYLFDNDMRHKIGIEAIKDNMFFVGDQDIEDAIDNTIWLQRLNNYFQDVLTFELEDVKGWKNEVVKGIEGKNDQKFYSILKKGIRNKMVGKGLEPLEHKQLPSKGSESADFLLQYIIISDEIPVEIKNAFDKLSE